MTRVTCGSQRPGCGGRDDINGTGALEPGRIAGIRAARGNAVVHIRFAIAMDVRCFA